MAYPFTVWFRRRLRQYLLEHRVSRNELARKLETTGATLHRYDRGLSFPDVDMQSRLAELFGDGEEEVARLVRESEKQRRRDAAGLADTRAGDAGGRKRESWLGGLAGTGRIVGDVVLPVTRERDWEVLR